MIELINIAKFKPYTTNRPSLFHAIYSSACETEMRSKETCALADKDDISWLTIDLLCDYPIETIRIENKNIDYADENLNLFVIDISCDYINWVRISPGIYSLEKNLLSAQLGSTVTARYVKFSTPEKLDLIFDFCIYSKKDHILDAEKKFIAPKPNTNPDNENSPIKIAVLGTSNSIMRNGYTYTLSNKETEVIKNISIGSSHSTVIPQQLIKLDEIEFDVLIIDISVNELRAFSRSKDLYNLKTSENIYNYLLCWCHKKNVIPVFLILPTNVKSFNHKVITEFYEKLCIKNKQFYFNGYHYLDRLSQLTNRSFDSFFNDPLHLNQLTASTLGRHLAHKISELFDTNKTKDIIITENEVDYLEFKFVKPSNFKKVITRKTSLIEEELIVLNKFDSAEIKHEEDFIIAGISLNMTQTNSLVKISGEKHLLKSFENNFYNEEKPLVLVNWQIINTVESKNKRIDLSIEELSLDNEIEFNDHLNIRKIKDLKNQKLELYGATIQLKKSRRGFFRGYHVKSLALNDHKGYECFYSILRDEEILI